MKETYWGYWIIILGVFVVLIMLLVQNVTSNTTEDYYTLKQVTEAAMVDAVDYAYYRDYGELKINKEKFIESFLRRFAEDVSEMAEYTILFSGIYEAPPKVSVQVQRGTVPFTINMEATDFDIVSRIDQILELN